MKKHILFYSFAFGLILFIGACTTTKNSSITLHTSENKKYDVYKTGFTQKPLPYNYNAFTNVIDEETMRIHYTKHGAAYSKNLQDAAKAENVADTTPVEIILKNIDKYSIKMRNNAGGHYNHEMFWQVMQPVQPNNKPTGKLLQMINADFGSYDSLKNSFSAQAKSLFGSGWVWLMIDDNGKLQVISTANQDNPLMNIAKVKGFPLLNLDVWEHAYYLKYQNKRADYIDNWWQIVNWNYVTKRLDDYIATP